VWGLHGRQCVVESAQPWVEGRILVSVPVGGGRRRAAGEYGACCLVSSSQNLCSPPDTLPTPHQAAKAANKGQNPKAFAFQSAGKARSSRARSAEKEQRRMHGARRGGCGRGWLVGPLTSNRHPLSAAYQAPPCSTNLPSPTPHPPSSTRTRIGVCVWGGVGGVV